ncbi:O-acetylserine/cysteine efflux transporter [Tamaricihabitans halophyticus]|uniref:O-acetylserine/cysteine efflux transporter n=1 Tax=Tamaricihabitans halophyticus TaxID=1262583 RepID=A0A4R2QXW4_9PSEU|nr:EamA family transporter [Tamaricihabitans halophyticus]TCP54214.1 O-acetylserine/cysteine efflux transporter [Tamaricihabitans halophyticus]
MPIRDRFLAVLVAAIWGMNFIGVHAVLQHFPPLFAAAIRFTVLAIPTLLFVRPPRVPWYWVVGYGLGFGTAQFGFLFVAMNVGMPTGLASLVLQTSAPFTVLLGALWLRERPRPRQFAGLALALAGMTAIAWYRAEVAALLPVLLTICAAVGWAVGNVCNRKALVDATTTDRSTPIRLTLWMTVVPPIPLFALSASTEGLSAGWTALRTATDSATGWLALGGLAYIVLLATLIGSAVWTALLRRNPAGVVAPFSLLVPVVGISLAWLLLAEQPALLEIIAGVVVVLGVLLGIPRATGKRKRDRTGPRAPAPHEERDPETHPTPR